ncbi:MAG: hypothetical protein E7473_07620 [Ruminococcaceae bacterium]|nr:hypothetical protein [Oscillospiraceae bacterium]
MSERPMLLLSIVERDKGKKLIKTLEKMNIRVNFQCVGFGTAPTEMMNIFGFGAKDKDIVISLGAETAVRSMMTNFGENFVSHTKYGGVMIILKISAANRILTEILRYDSNNANSEKETTVMKNEYHNNLIIISVNEGFSDDVMQVARKAGATGGTVIKGRLASFGELLDPGKNDTDDDREIICILAQIDTGKKIMEEVNREFGMKTEAKGVTIAIPAEKAYKI